MSNYRRLISYIYAYEGGVKGKNIGFAKIDSRGIQCRITVSVKKIYVGSSDIGVYLLTGEKEIPLGSIFIRGGCGEFRTVVSSSDVEHSGFSMDQCYGLTVHDVNSTWRSYTTIWEDAVAHAAEVELDNTIKKDEENTGISEAQIKKAMREIEEEFPLEPVMAAEYAAELSPENENLSNLGSVALPDQGPEYIKLSADSGKAMETGVSEDVQTVEAEALQMNEAEPLQVMESEPAAAEEQAGETVQAGQIMQASESEQASEIVQVSEAEVTQSEEMGATQSAGGEVQPPGGMDVDLTSVTVTQKLETPKAETETGQPKRPVNSEEQQSEASQRSAQQPGGMQIPMGEQEDPTHDQVWMKLKQNHAKVLPFDYEHGCEVITIKPQDIGLLPREIWVYGNNSFLLHGFYNYRYLILGKLNNPKGAPFYMLGVPGHYYNNERYMASMFGFPNFVLSKDQPDGDDRFGYWYTFVSLGN